MSGTPWLAARELSWRTGRANPTAPTSVALEDAIGRISAGPLSSLVDLPTASVSAMDGWAVAGEPPWLLGERVGMGSIPDQSALRPSTARPITTGAPVPSGTFGVLRNEHGDVRSEPDGQLWLRRGSAAGASQPSRDADIRQRGEELEAGTVLVRAGSVLTPARIALAAACGHDSLWVQARPRVSVLITGDELLSAGTPPAGSVRDALGPILPRLVHNAGGTHVERHRVRDNQPDTTAAIDAADCDLLVTTGGSSRGTTDFVRSTLLNSGGVVFDGVRMRPGHPVLLGHSRGGTPVLALPGNPLAAIACFVSFGIPLIRGMLGLGDEILAEIDLPDLPPTVTDAVSRQSTVLVPFTREHGVPVISLWRGPAMLRGLADAEGMLVVEPAHTPSGYRVKVLDLPW